MAVCLLACWLAAIHHCALEAADLIEHHASENVACCAGGEQHCSHDGCDVVENGVYRLDHASLKVTSPVLAACAFVLYADVLAPPREAARGVVARDRPTVPLDWVPAWHFVRRAAALAHAPDTLIA